jgi:vanadium chloroperoxidase
MIEENGRSRVYLGVHWVFDAFVVTDDGELNLARTDDDGKPFGGVPLGLQIAEDIFQHGDCKAPKESIVVPRVQPAAVPEGRTPTHSSSFLR